MIMDEDRKLTDELERMQSSISALFRGVVNDKNKYKQEKDRSVEYVETLMIEITNLRKENEQLRRCNSGGSSCMTCSQLKEQLIIQDMRSKKLEKCLDILTEMVCNVNSQNGDSDLSKLLSIKIDELNRDCQQGKDTRSSGHVLSGVDATGKCMEEDEVIIHDTFYGKTEPCHSRVSNSKIGEEENQLKKSSNHNEAVETAGEDSYLDLIPSGADSKAKFELMEAEFRSPEKVNKSELDFIGSPFRSNSSIRKGEKSPILVDQRLLANRNAIPGSPNCLKRKAISMSPGKLINKALFPKSPKQRKYKSPVKGSRMKSASQLKSSNSLEAEVSLSGVRKLKQTQLNPDYYKSRSQDAEISDNYSSDKKLNDENKFGEDDLILESPKHSANFFDEFKKSFRREEEESEETMTSDDGRQSESIKMEVFDPEETFVSSTFIRNSLKDVKVPKREKEPSPKGNSRSPEYNTVPYPYKGSPVRKRAERMRLPGQTCMECNKYYKAILGEIDPRKLQEILNQCSRHRDQHYNIVDTPPGYWKPYLTATMDGSAMEDDDTHFGN